jgi:titin
MFFCWRKWLTRISTSSRQASPANPPRRSIRPVVEELEGRTVPATITVTNAANAGAGSLRQAILDSNQSVGVLDTIEFLIPGGQVHTIRPTSQLPTIEDAVIINGYSQPGSKANTQADADDAVLRIVLDGQGKVARGLLIEAGGTTVRGLVFNGFDAAIAIRGAGGNTIAGNFIGTDSTGTKSRGNFLGVSIFNSAGNIIGGSSPADRNLISGNETSELGSTAIGVSIAGPDSKNNQVLGNFIGVAASGQKALENGLGVEISGGARGNTIGGTANGARNVISGNDGSGILIFQSLFAPARGDHAIQGNYIGTSATGDAAIPNGGDGISVTRSSNNLIGGVEAGARNLISGNRRNGVEISGRGVDRGGLASDNSIQGNFIGVAVDGLGALANGTTTKANAEKNGVYIDAATTTLVGGSDAAARNIISANRGSGIKIENASATGNEVLGNYIGTDQFGLRDKDGNGNRLGNGLAGVFVLNASRNIIGKMATAIGSPPGNIISGNLAQGIRIVGTTGTPARSNRVQGNYIGVDVNGTAALPNSGDGIDLADTLNTFIGGENPLEGNVISGNNGNGILIADSKTDLLFSNLIGTNAAGSAALGNGLNGIFIFQGEDHLIGGDAQPLGSAPANVISGNGTRNQVNNQEGIKITGSTQNRIVGNLIGTDQKGTTALGNHGSGVYLDGQANNNEIGGPLGVQGNVISGNLGHGINGKTDNTVFKSNRIGEDINRDKLENGKQNQVRGNNNRFEGNSIAGGPGAGIEITGSGNQIVENTISETGGAGVVIVAGRRNLISRNSIFDNAGIGIDLAGDGVTPNDAADNDQGPNGLQNFPVLTSATLAGNVATVEGTLRSRRNTTFIVEFFANTVGDPTGHGEGERFVGSAAVTTDSTGNASFSFSFAADSSSAGQFLAATATHPVRGTSEFSAVIPVTRVAVATTTSVVSSNSNSVFGEPVAFTASVSAASGPPTGSVQFLVDGVSFGGPVALSGGSASVATNLLAVGGHTVSAIYNPDDGFAGSSGFVLQNVALAPTEIRIDTDPNPSNESDIVRLLIAFRAAPPSTIMPGSGVIDFFDTFNDETRLWFSVTLGQPSPPIPLLEPGSHTLFAVYSGNESFLGSTSNFHSHEVLPSSSTSTAGFSAIDQVFSSDFAGV